jgi:hypothetical protein
MATVVGQASRVNTSFTQSAVSLSKAAEPPKPPQNTASEVVEEDAMDVKEVKTLFTPYTAQCAWYAHPTLLVETTTSSYAKPVVDSRLLHKNIKYNKEVSRDQQDLVVLTMEAHMRGLGILIGDGTGVGKGREMAACIENTVSLYPETCKIVFVTASNHLINDFQRDLSDIGCKLQLRSLGDNWKKTDEKIKFRGILFVTYKLLARSQSAGTGKQKASRSRVDQIVEWLNSDSPQQTAGQAAAVAAVARGGKNGLIVFDEVHVAKTKTSATNKAVIRLQELLPNANVIYASATAMSSIDHLSPMYRLGIWGPGTAYENYKAFEEKWKNQTRSGLEIVSAELASRGLYVARRLSLEGAEFKTTCCDMTEEQLSLHSNLAKWWTELSLMDNVLAGKEARGKLWGDHLRFFKALLVAFRVEHCVDLSSTEIANGNSVVISLIGTGEAATKRAMDSDDSNDEEGIVALKHTMETIINYAIENYQGPSIPNRLYELKGEIETFDLPQSPLDLLIDRLSSLKNEKGENERVVELTGRTVVYRKDSQGKWTIMNRTKKGDGTKEINIRGCKLFQSGKARIAIISAAAGCGISLQNDKNGPDRRRIHIQMELAWAADQAMQMLGRTMRSRQHNAPMYIQFASPFAAEKRFAQTVAERAQRLGAATTADRRGSSSDRAFGSNLLVGSHASDAMHKMCSALARDASWPKWIQYEQDTETGNPTESWTNFSKGVVATLKGIGIDGDSPPTRLLGRLLGVELEESNKCMRIFESACLESLYQSMSEKSDKADLGVEDVCLGDKSQIISTSEGGLIQIATDIGLSFDEALNKGNNSPDTKFIFCTRIDRITQRRFTVLAQQLKAHVRITRPNGRVAIMHYADFKHLYNKFKRIKDPETDAEVEDYDLIRKTWTEEYDLCLTTCIHGSGCKIGKECTFGKRSVNTCLVKMPGALNSLRNYNGSRQIIRLSNESEADGGERCVAVRISNIKSPQSDLIEEDLLSEKRRNKQTQETVSEKKQKLFERMDKLEEDQAQKTKASSSASNCSFESNDSDDESEASNDDSDDYMEYPFAGVKRKKRDSSSSDASSSDEEEKIRRSNRQTKRSVPPSSDDESEHEHDADMDDVDNEDDSDDEEI